MVYVKRGKIEQIVISSMSGIGIYFKENKLDKDCISISINGEELVCYKKDGEKLAQSLFELCRQGD